MEPFDISQSIVSLLTKSTFTWFKMNYGGHIILYFTRKDENLEFTLWLDNPWRATISSKLVASSNATTESNLGLINSHTGGIVEKALIHSIELDMKIELSTGLCFEKFVCTTQGDDWQLRMADGLRYNVGEGYQLFSWKVNND